MSMYRNLHGENVQAPYLKKILGFHILNNDGYRYRDTFLKDGGRVILLLTRIGGNNRKDYPNQIKAFQDHPCYIKDYDDDFDSTFAYFEFRTPQDHAETCKKFFIEDPKSLKERSEAVMKEMAEMPKDAVKKDKRFKSLFDIIEQIEKVSKGEQEPPENNIFTV